ncbi:MAG: hypothetical protein L3J76_05715 [Candidatus Hydrothermae bacterium]|nr:hypothetical protein [Candidatus Hydrothermae bacterium]
MTRLSPSDPVLRLRLIPGRITVFEAVQFVLLLGESGLLKGPEGCLGVAPGKIVGATCPPQWTGEKALERFWFRTREGEVTFVLTEKVPAQGFAYREMDLLEFQARSDEFWGMLRSQGVDLDHAFGFVDGGPRSMEIPDTAKAFVDRLKNGPVSLAALLDSSPLPDLVLVRMLINWLHQGWVRTMDASSTPSPAGRHVLRTVVMFMQAREEVEIFFRHLGLSHYQKRRGRHVVMAYLGTPHGRIQFYGVHGLREDTPLLFLQPLLQRAHLVLVAPTVECPRDVQAHVKVPCLALRGEGETWYLNTPGEDLQAVLLRHLAPVA